MSAGVVLDRAAIEQKSFAMLDAMADAGLADAEIGAMLLGMAVSALTEGGKTCRQIHEMINEMFAQRGASQ